MATRTTPITFETFSTRLNALPFTPSQENARGVLAPLMRSAGHLLFLMAATSTTPPLITDAEQTNELDHAAAHLAATNLASINNFSTAGKNHVEAYVDLVGAAQRSWGTWTPDNRAAALRNLVNRSAGLASYLDRELIGLTPAQTDPGTSL